MSRLLSEKVTLGLGGGYSRRFTDGLQVLNDLGLQVPLTRSEALDANGRFDVRLTQRTRWSADFQYNRVEFDSDELVDTDSMRASSTLAVRTGARDEIWVNYFFRRTNRDVGFDAHAAGMGWGHTFSPRVSISVDAGASYVPSTSGAGEDTGGGLWFSYGGLSLTGTGRRSSLTLTYRKGITPGYGLGRNLDSDIVRLTVSTALGRNGSLAITGTHTWSRDVFVSTERFTSDYAVVDLSRRFGRHVGLSLSYAYRRREVEESVPVGSHRAGLSIGYALGGP